MDLESTLRRLVETSDEEVNEWSPVPFGRPAAPPPADEPL
jgi:hypothetical protein